MEPQCLLDDTIFIEIIDQEPPPGIWVIGLTCAVTD